MTPQEQQQTEAPKPEVVTPPTQAIAPVPQERDVATLSWFRGVPPDHVLNRMYGFAKAICNAAFISPVVRGDVASVFYLVSMAEDLGIQWTHGLRSIYPLVKKGKDGLEDQIRAGIQGDIALAMLLKAKFEVKVKESTDEICTVWIKRPDGLMEFEDSFTIAEAIKLNLTGKPNWAYKKDMLRWRAVMRVARIVAADLLGGLHLPDELQELPPENGDGSNKVFSDYAKEHTNPFHVEDSRNDTPTETASTEAPTKTEVVQPGEKTAPNPPADKGNGFKATDDDVPENLGGTPAKPGPTLLPPASGSSQVERGGYIIRKIAAAAGLEDKYVEKEIFERYMRAFLNMTKLPKKPDSRYNVPLDLLESMVNNTEPNLTYVADLVKGAHEMGTVSRAGWEAMLRRGWDTPELAEEAKLVTVDRFPDDGGQSLLTFLDDVVEADGKEKPSELLAFLRLYRISRKALDLRAQAIEKGLLLSDMVKGLDLEKATQKDILTMIVGAGPKPVSSPPADKQLWEE